MVVRAIEARSEECSSTRLMPLWIQFRQVLGWVCYRELVVLDADQGGPRGATFVRGGDLDVVVVAL